MVEHDEVQDDDDEYRGPLRRWFADTYGALTDGQRWTIGVIVVATIVLLGAGLRHAPNVTDNFAELTPARSSVPATTNSGDLGPPLSLPETTPLVEPFFTTVIPPYEAPAEEPTTTSTSTTSTTSAPTTTTTTLLPVTVPPSPAP